MNDEELPLPIIGEDANVLVHREVNSTAALGSIVMGFLVLLAVIGVSTGSAVVVILALVVAAIIGLFIVPRMLASLRWNPTELHLAAWPLELGSTTAVVVVRTSKRAIPDASIEIEVVVECEERATYSVGSTTETKKATVYHETLQARGELVAGTFRAEANLRIPVNAGAPSMDLGNNEIEWKLIVTPSDPLPRWPAEFVIDVTSVLALGSGRVQDI